MARPRKGLLIRLDGSPGSSTADALVFQYNPEYLTRRLLPGGTAAPVETITCTLDFDATDALEIGDDADPYVVHGVTPSLAALELLTYGTAPQAPSFWDRLFGRTPPAGSPPVVLFNWGPQRAVPVRITRLDVKELLHDPELRPLRATVRVQMEVVTAAGAGRARRTTEAWRRYEKAMQDMAQLGYQDVPLGGDDR